MRTDDERSWDHNGRDRYEYRESKPPPDLHCVESIDKSPEIEQE